jgi:hypothetical protein
MREETMKIRNVSLAVLTLGAAFVMTALPVSPARAQDHMAMSTADSGPSPSQFALKQAMRKLWSDHVIWTREYVVAAVNGSSDAQAAAARLLKNQEDIGAAIVPFYGQEAGDKLTALLKQHIIIAVDVVNAAKANDQARLQEASAKWKQNGADIANFLSKANSNWPGQAMVDAMNMHLETTTREVVDRLQKNYDDDVKAFDAIYDHILKMSDVLADGIVKQFPARFSD